MEVCPILIANHEGKPQDDFHFRMTLNEKEEYHISALDLNVYEHVDIDFDKLTDVDFEVHTDCILVIKTGKNKSRIYFRSGDSNSQLDFEQMVIVFDQLGVYIIREERLNVKMEMEAREVEVGRD